MSPPLVLLPTDIGTVLTTFLFASLSQTVAIYISADYWLFTGPICDLAVSVNGELASTVSDDKVVKVFDVVNFGNYLWSQLIISFLFAVLFLFAVFLYVNISPQYFVWGNFVFCFWKVDYFPNDS